MKKVIITYVAASFVALNAGTWGGQTTANQKSAKNPKIERLNMVRDKMRKDLKIKKNITQKNAKAADFRESLMEQKNSAQTEADKTNALVQSEQAKKIETDPAEILRERKRKQREERLRKIREQRERFKNRMGIRGDK